MESKNQTSILISTQQLQGDDQFKKKRNYNFFLIFTKKTKLNKDLFTSCTISLIKTKKKNKKERFTLIKKNDQTKRELQPKKKHPTNCHIERI